MSRVAAVVFDLDAEFAPEAAALARADVVLESLAQLGEAEVERARGRG